MSRSLGTERGQTIDRCLYVTFVLHSPGIRWRTCVSRDSFKGSLWVTEKCWWITSIGERYGCSPAMTYIIYTPSAGPGISRSGPVPFVSAAQNSLNNLMICTCKWGGGGLSHCIQILLKLWVGNCASAFILKCELDEDISGSLPTLHDEVETKKPQNLLIGWLPIYLQVNNATVSVKLLYINVRIWHLIYSIPEVEDLLHKNYITSPHKNTS